MRGEAKGRGQDRLPACLPAFAGLAAGRPGCTAAAPHAAHAAARALTAAAPLCRPPRCVRCLRVRPLPRSWRFPGVGEYQCCDKYMLADLRAAARAVGHPEWGHGGPHDAGHYNSRSWETGFFVSQVRRGCWGAGRL